MKRTHVKIALAVAAVAAVGAGAGTVAMASSGGGGGDREILTGYEEVPALSTPGVGELRTSISRSSDEIRYRLSFSGLESDAQAAHLHFENETNNGPIVVFLCTNLPGGPEGTQPCPTGGGTIEGTITPADIGPGAAEQGLDAGEFDEFVRAVRAGAIYVNVHSTDRPAGEIRAQLEGDGGRFRS